MCNMEVKGKTEEGLTASGKTILRLNQYSQ